VKTNIGHLESAAGVTGLIKTALMLKHRIIPTSLHYSVPNPKIDFANSPFHVSTQCSDWGGPAPRRAGVSAFGVGGTNAHVVLEEAAEPTARAAALPAQLLTLSAKTESALDSAMARLGDFLWANPQIDLADAAFTLQAGRRAFPHRRAVLARDAVNAGAALAKRDPKRVFSGLAGGSERRVAFMFPGQGAQDLEMGAELYGLDGIFRSEVDRCCEMLQPHLGFDLRGLLFRGDARGADAEAKLNQTAITQPALFVVEYALARLLIEAGIAPEAMIGHSVGEYVAACLAGVFSLPDALALVATRGRLIQALPPGAMLAVRLDEAEVRGLLGEEVSIAAVNGPSLCVLSGPLAAIADLEAHLTARDVMYRRLRTSHAFHSAMMDPILPEFAKAVETADPKRPRLPFVSTVTANWISEAEATDCGYWTRHVRQTVEFARGVQQLHKEPSRVLLEVGPGKTLATLAKQAAPPQPALVLASLGDRADPIGEVGNLLQAIGRLWVAGADVRWSAVPGSAGRRRISLPTYPFERKRYWVDPPPLERRERTLSAATAPALGHREEPASQPQVAEQPPGLVAVDGEDADFIHRVVREQLDLMARQLATLGASATPNGNATNSEE
jgi:acyl transferase domain-containing protein